MINKPELTKSHCKIHDLGCFTLVAKDNKKYYINISSKNGLEIKLENKSILNVKSGWTIEKAVNWINL